MKKGAVLGILIFIIAGVAILGFVLLSGHKKSPPIIFQPEAQMITQAVDAAKNIAKSGTSAPRAPALTPSLPLYTYDATVCATASNGICFEHFYGDLVKNYGVDVAVRDIKKRYGENSLIVSQCHPIMHVIGREASALYPTISEAYHHGDSFCWSGYYHGILEGVVGRIGKKNLPAKLDTICADIPGKASYTFDYYNCVHGLGHGIMELLGDDVFSSLTMCDNLTGDWERQSCDSGVFMENIISFDRDGFSDFLKPSDPLYPCDAVADSYKMPCYLGQTSYALQISNYNFQKIFALCATVTEPWRDICNQSMGRDVANQARHDPLKTKSFCSIPADPNDQANCITGAVKEIISYYHSDTQAKDFCAALDSNYKPACFATTQSYYAGFQ